jgi:hypothetical protein
MVHRLIDELNHDLKYLKEAPSTIQKMGSRAVLPPPGSIRITDSDIHNQQVKLRRIYRGGTGSGRRRELSERGSSRRRGCGKGRLRLLGRRLVSRDLGEVESAAVIESWSEETGALEASDALFRPRRDLHGNIGIAATGEGVAVKRVGRTRRHRRRRFMRRAWSRQSTRAPPTTVAREAGQLGCGLRPPIKFRWQRHEAG